MPFSQLRRSQIAALALTFLAQIIAAGMLWRLPFLPFEDHPSHLLREFAWLHLNDPNFGFAQYFVSNCGLSPNQGSDAVVCLLGQFMGAELASRGMYILYVLLLPAAYGYFLYRGKPENLIYLPVISVFTLTYFVMMGNENFFWSLLYAFPALGLALQMEEEPSRLAWAILLALVTATYFCHMLTFSWLSGTLLCLAVFSPRRNSWLPATVGCISPGAVFGLLWHHSLTGATRASSAFPSLEKKLHSLTMGVVPAIAFNGSAPDWLGVLVLLAVLVAVVLGYRSDSKRRPGLLLALAAVTFVALCLPRWFLIFEPGQRFIYLCLLAALPLLPAPSPKFSPKAILAGFAAILALLRIAEWSQLQQNSEITARVVAPFQQVPATPPGGRMVAIMLPPYLQIPAAHRAFEYYNL